MTSSPPAPFKTIFVGGVMRSGTSLLHQVICTSPDANPYINSCRYLTDQLTLYARYSGGDSLFVDDYFADRETFRAFTIGILDGILQAAWQTNGRPKALVLKNVELTVQVPLLAGLLPEARFVLSVREPKDVAASMIKVGEKQRQAGLDTFLVRAGAGRAIDALCDTINGYYAPTLRALQDGDGDDGLKDRVLFVRYEDTVTTPDETAARVFQFCDITPGRLPEDGDWRRSGHTGKIAEHARWRTYLTDLSAKPVSAAHVGAHGAVLSPDEAARIDERCRGLRKTFGYV